MIRPATEDDFDAIEIHCSAFWNETQFSDIEYKKGASLPYIKLALDHGLLFVLELNGEVVGFAAGCVSPLMGDPDKLSGTEMAWWVDPSCRGSSGGIKLLIALEEKAKELGCIYWNMVSMKSSMPDQINSIYQRLGYKLEESTYTKRLI